MREERIELSKSFRSSTKKIFENIEEKKIYYKREESAPPPLSLSRFSFSNYTHGSLLPPPV